MKKQMNYTFDRIRIVMLNTSEAGNIGAAARAMKNMSLTKLYLVNPKHFPSATATARASGADDVLANAIICENLSQALIGVQLVIGASARQRSQQWRQLDVVDSCVEIKKTLTSKTQQVAVVFGTENRGLTNAELDLCQILMTIPGNADYFSLNVAAAVQVFAYQNFILNQQTTFSKKIRQLAGNDEMEGFYAHLLQVLTHLDYFKKNLEKTLLMRRLRRFFMRAAPEKEELAIFRGILHKIKPYQKP